MPIFVEAYESIHELILAESQVTEDLNKRLLHLQQKKAKIIDVKVSLAAYESGEIRTYLIIYEAEKPIEPLKK